MPYTTSKDISFGTVIRRGLRRRCPNCGEGRSFRGYLTVADAIPNHPDCRPYRRTTLVDGRAVLSLVNQAPHGGMVAYDAGLDADGAARHEGRCRRPDVATWPYRK